jgi:alkylation response protein AidB-like acyl-CoA dehydrogenase
MDLELNDFQVELRESAAAMLARHAPLSLAREYLEGRGEADALWAQIAGLGWLEVGLDQADPFGVPGLCLLAEQVGRHAAPTTLVDTALVARVAAVVGGPRVAQITAGEAPLALAMLEPARSWCSSTRGTIARRDRDLLVVSGEKTGVHHATAVALLAVVLELDGSPAIALIAPGDAGVTITPLGGIDPSCAPCLIAFDDVRAAEADLLAGPAVEAALAHALDVAAVATTAEGLGAASAALDMAIAYALEREQYGRQIGAFQGLQQLIAEQHVLRETAWASVLYAAAALEERTDDAASAAAVAKAHGAAATKAVAEGALQVFGGVGFTREHDLHLLYRRALECAGRFGGAVDHERRVADALLSPEPALAGRRS